MIAPIYSIGVAFEMDLESESEVHLDDVWRIIEFMNLALGLEIYGVNVTDWETGRQGHFVQYM